MGRAATALVRVVVAVCVLLILGWLALSPVDPALYPPARPERIAVTVIDHGWHTGLALRPDDLNGAAVRLALPAPEAAERLRWLATRFPGEDWIEIGWGDAGFYQVTPGVADIDPWLAFRALAWPTPSVLQIVPGRGPVREAYPNSDLVDLDLSTAGFDRMAAALAASVPPDGQRPPLGASLYGWGAFFPAVPSYHLFRTCNVWTSALLRAAGVPSSAMPSIYSGGLMAELRWRAI
jgi:uncharacterized protein (TIGR02117 family)